jgi:signal transduction histidine kinase
MKSTENDGGVVEMLRGLVRQNLKEARQQVRAMLAGDPTERDALLSALGGVGDGRLRQCVANVVIADQSLLQVTMASLQAWLAAETDEFARKAIASALQQSPTVKRSSQKAGLIDPSLVAAYRYVSDRLAHELRNTLLIPQGRLGELHALISGLSDDQTRARIISCLGQLGDEFQEVGRLAVSNPDDEYFRFRPITILDWIERMKGAYAKRYSALGFESLGSPIALATKVMANDYFLRLTFWNLWLNSHQAIGSACKITVEFSTDAGKLRLVVLDNGGGFRADAVGVAFHDRFSKNGDHRGRGLLEVQDAVEQLQGTAELVKHASGTYRVALTLPVSAP